MKTHLFEAVVVESEDEGEKETTDSPHRSFDVPGVEIEFLPVRHAEETEFDGADEVPLQQQPRNLMDEPVARTGLVVDGRIEVAPSFCPLELAVEGEAFRVTSQLRDLGLVVVLSAGDLAVMEAVEVERFVDFAESALDGGECCQSPIVVDAVNPDVCALGKFALDEHGVTANAFK